MNVEGWAASVSGVLSTGVLGYMLKSAVRLEVLERLFEEKKNTIEAVKTGQESMDKRLTRVEDAVVGLNDALPELRKLGALTGKLEIFMTMRDSQIERLENTVFGDKDK